ncbi:hypothetical protein [Bacillus cereus]|uniref:hypothetical protein n=1 Tax=Bacillus cereus TaxID=1396 RepID=UPI000BEBE3CF|nr:hypothetical protein [Bacillus cereus]MEB8798967.1 hypothetical protein [Bacillus cereus]MEB8811374.1 hypothetical protein [Bacillus cereus]MEB8995093.1 hypothetical protein [Bacillus cereus]MEB9183020.1 hypothetical protein [Bacillus cereus]MEC3021861.1 hypothetical protein [Bacillus cereus]
MKDIEIAIKHYYELKKEMLHAAKCINCCLVEEDKDLYREITGVYSKKMKSLEKCLSNKYCLHFCHLKRDE